MLESSRPVRPVDAAGLVLLRGNGVSREVLLGRRRRSARFLPGVYVFPGGRLERADRDPVVAEERFSPPPDGLDAATRSQVRALARAALRETAEETGILLGRPLPDGSRIAAGGAWQDYAAASLAPAFEAMRLFVRAITPTSSPIRFHTRFFVAEAAGLAYGTPRDDELEDVAWVPVGEATRLPMVDVTLFVLEQALAAAPSAKVPLFSYQERARRAALRGRRAAPA